jgi:hypothetical protein
MTLSLDEFLRRFLLHVLPDGFVRIRNFGFLAETALGPSSSVAASATPATANGFSNSAACSDLQFRAVGQFPINALTRSYPNPPSSPCLDVWRKDILSSVENTLRTKNNPS